MRPWTNRTILLGSVGLAFTFIGAAVYLLRNYLYEHIIQSALSLSPNSKSYELWRNTSSLSTNLDIYMFNWTNPEELMDPGKKPNLVQLGPYSFTEKRIKVNVTFHPENGTVSYMQRRTWFFDSSRSNGSLQDKISQLNVVAVSAAHKIRYWPYVIQQSLSYMLNQFSHQIHIVRTVDELLFTGFEDKLITMGKLSGLDEDAPPFDKFGWFYMRNGSTDFDGYSNMATGIDDIGNLGKIMSWNHKDTTNYYKSPCNAVEGSAGEFWPPHRTTEDIQLFSPDICRPVTFEFVDKVKYKDIEGYKFALGRKTLSNDTRRRYPHDQAKYFEPTTTTEDFFSVDPTTLRIVDEEDESPDVVNEGQCYCNGECSPMGLINVTSCRYGAPGFISLPHFYNADPVLASSFRGLHPKEETHDFHITLEPITGIPIDVSARLQVNILLHPSKTVYLFKDVPTLYFPMLWFEMKVEIPDDMIGSFKLLLNLPHIMMYIGIIMIFIGSLVLFGVAVICYVNHGQQLTLNIASKIDVSQKKTEMIYLDKPGANEDPQSRSNRRLYPKS